MSPARGSNEMTMRCSEHLILVDSTATAVVATVVTLLPLVLALLHELLDLHELAVHLGLTLERLG